MSSVDEDFGTSIFPGRTEQSLLCSVELATYTATEDDLDGLNLQPREIDGVDLVSK